VTTLTLDTPEARRALARCTRLLLRWADEKNKAADGENLAGDTPSAAVTSPRTASHSYEGTTDD